MLNTCYPLFKVGGFSLFSHQVTILYKKKNICMLQESKCLEVLHEMSTILQPDTYTGLKGLGGTKQSVKKKKKKE